MTSPLRKGLAALTLTVLITTGAACSDDNDGGDQAPSTTQPDSGRLQEGDVERPNTGDEAGDTDDDNGPSNDADGGSGSSNNGSVNTGGNDG